MEMETRSKINFLGSSSLIKILSCAICYLFLSLSFQSFADDGDDEEDYPTSSMNPIGREDIEHRLKPLGFGLMGDRIDTDKGTVVFNVTDVSIPGNSNLEVAIRRTTGSWSYTYRQDHFLGDWILDVPSISTLVQKDTNWDNSRCSTGPRANRWNITKSGSYEIPSYWTGVSEWYDGFKLNIPGQGSKPLFRPYDESRWPSSLYSSKTGYLENQKVEMVTTDHWTVVCGVSATQKSGHQDSNGAGEGFMVIAPNGNRYTMSQVNYFPASRYITPKRLHQVPILERSIASVMATKVEDIHGNWVKYDYDSGGRLTKIYSNDDRKILIGYKSGTNLISSVNANGRVWRYEYQGVTEYLQSTNSTFSNPTVQVLKKVTQPDGLFWEYNIHELTRNEPSFFQDPDQEKTISLKHPAGMRADYIIADANESPVEGTEVTFAAGTEGYSENLLDRPYIYYRRIKTATQKTLSGPSVPTSTWDYEVPEYSGVMHGIKTTDPSGRYTTYAYQDYTPSAYSSYLNGSSLCYRGTARKLANRIVYESKNGQVLESLTNIHDDSSEFGDPGLNADASESAPSCEVYLSKSEITRGNDKYTTEYTYETDPESPNYSYGQPLSQTNFSNISTVPRVTVNTYKHNKDAWILGQLETVTTNDRLMVESEYDWWGRMVEESYFGGESAKFNYHCSSSNLYSFTDANNKTTLALDYYRGVPKIIERADESRDELKVDDNGWIMAQKDFRGYWTNYDRDNMGRVTKIIPSKTQKSWLDTTIDYDFGNEITQTITRNDREEVITYDNFQRVILEKIEDLDEQEAIYTRTEYNEAGEEVFKSFPSFDPNETDGIEKNYDGLGRLRASQETVVPYALTSYDYLDSHRKDVTDPNGNTTSYYYTGYNGPGKGKLRQINQPLGVSTQFTRNVWDQLIRLRQYGTQNGRYMNQYRYFAYDSQQRLCKKAGRETNSTLYQYDAVGNMIAYQEGAPYSSSSSCSTLSSSTKVSLELDDLYRVTRTNFASAATPDIYKTYGANGNVLSVNRAGANWTYTYDELNHLTSEKLDIDGRNFDLAYTYNSDEQLTHRTLPSGRRVEYEYDALGRAIGVQDDDASYAGIHYHPSGSVKRMSYGNRVVLYQNLNQRLMLDRIFVEDDNAEIVHNLEYEYDELGNLTEVLDDFTGLGTKSMEYDALGRLTNADGVWGEGSFEYDALGNLRSKVLGSRTVTNNYSSYYNRIISSVDTAGTNRSVSYDSRGNVIKLGDLDFAYDYVNQPVQVSGSSNGSYKYDGNLKRVKAVIDGKTVYNIFDSAGKLVYVDEISDGKKTEYIHAAGQTIARIGNNDVTYIHSDHLGSPIAGTNSSGRVVWREEYTPFGEKFISNAANDDLGSYTGHIHDSSTGLTYMQARYYDPALGRFLSNDPVGFRVNSPDSFNRYRYAKNNPYLYTDPTGMVDNADSWFTGDINGDSAPSSSNNTSKTTYNAKQNASNNLSSAIARGFGSRNGGTSGLSINFNAGMGGGISGGFNLVWDSQGNIALQEVKGVGIESLGVSLMLNAEETNAGNVFQLEGRGGQGGVDGGFVLSGEGGGMLGNGYEGYYAGGGFSAGWPIGASVYTTDTDTLIQFNIYEVIDDVKRLFSND